MRGPSKESNRSLSILFLDASKNPTYKVNLESDADETEHGAWVNGIFFEDEEIAADGSFSDLTALARSYLAGGKI